MLPELRGVVVGEMEPEDRCRFTRCSKASQKEAKSSKNYIYSLTFYTSWKYVNISISHEHGFKRDHKGFSLIFQEHEGKNIKRCTSDSGYLFNKEIWREDMDNSINVIEYGTELFKNLLKEYQNTIKVLNFSGRLENYDFEIESFKKLESLNINGKIDILYYLSKLKRPLKNISVNGVSCLADREELYQITDSVYMSSKLTYEQMCRLAAPDITIPFGDITEIEICNFIRSWQNGSKELKSYTWLNRGDLKFDIPRLFRLFGLNPDPPNQFGMITIRINHNTDAHKTATLNTVSNFSHLSFKVEDH